MLKAFSEVLEDLSGAEEFFSWLGDRYPAQIITLARSYTRRRMCSRLSSLTLIGLSQNATRALCRGHLEQAYTEFAAWTPAADHAATLVISNAIG